MRQRAHHLLLPALDLASQPRPHVGVSVPHVHVPNGQGLTLARFSAQRKHFLVGYAMRFQ